MKWAWYSGGLLVIISSFLVVSYAPIPPDTTPLVQMAFILIGILLIIAGMISGISDQLSNIEITYHPYDKEEIHRKD